MNDSIDVDNIDMKLMYAFQAATSFMEEEEDNCKKIGEYGFKLFEEILSKKKDKKLNILTHVQRRMLATVDYGTALAPIYNAFEKNIEIFVWVDETRPRNQGARFDCL